MKPTGAQIQAARLQIEMLKKLGRPIPAALVKMAIGEADA